MSDEGGTEDPMDRRSLGDRREGVATSVSVDELSNGARALIEEIRDEARAAREAAVRQAEQTREELKTAKIQSRQEFKEAKEAFLRAVFRTAVAAIGSAFILTFGLGAWYSKVNENIATLVVQADRTEDVVETLTRHSAALKALADEAESITTRVERLEDRH